MTSSASLRRALEAALRARPDDAAAHAAYADLLLEEDDPASRARGEFISVQLALENASLSGAERATLRAREEDLLEAHQRDWLGPLAPHLLHPENEVGAHFAFRRGWLDQLHLTNLTVPLARVLRQAEECVLLRDLAIEDARDEVTPTAPEDAIPEGDYEPGFWPLTRSTVLGNVRTLRLGEDDGDEYQGYRCHLYTQAVVPLVQQMPRLEELRLFAKAYDLADLFALPTLTNLRVLQVHHAVQVHRLGVLADNPAFANLTHLLIHPHHIAWWGHAEQDEADGFREAEGYLPLSVVRPLLRSPHLPKLTHLRLRVSSMGDEGCEEIVRSGILKRLKSLDVRHGRVTDRGAAILASCPDLKRLEWLDLDRNYLTPAGIGRIRGLGVPVRVDQQHLLFDEEEMSEEEEYLTEGEFE